MKRIIPLIIALILWLPGMPVTGQFDRADADDAAGLVEVVAGFNHNCARFSDGTLKCWGSDLSGQLGLADSRLENQSNALLVPNLTGTLSIALGNQNTCAVNAEGGVECWGDNSFAELGKDPDIVPESPAPVEVDGLTKKIDKVYAFNSNYCGLDSDGGIICWGREQYPPEYVTGLTSGFTKVAPGDRHACALTSEGEVSCWGKNDRGQLGVGDGDYGDLVVAVTLPGQAVDIDSGSTFTCAALADGSVACWGENTYGELGSEAPAIDITPVIIAGASGVARIAAGANHACGIDTNDRMWCWGLNNYSQLGDGTFQDSHVPVQAQLGDIIPEAAALGSQHSCVFGDDQKAYCWGSNTKGQVGDSAPLKYPLPAPVNGLGTGVSSLAEGISVGHLHTCAVQEDGDGMCWGLNTRGELGNQMVLSSPEPVQVAAPGVDFVQFSNGIFFSCGLTSAGGVMCWGSNHSGELGNGTDVSSLSPVDVTGLASGVAAIVSGYSHSCAMTDAGAVKCWGEGHDTPVEVLAGGVTQISARSNGSNTCALYEDGSVSCWGEDFTPFAVEGFSANIEQITVIYNRLCGLTASEVICNDFMTTGDTYTLDEVDREDVETFVAGVSDIGASCYIDKAGGVKCFGKNQFGQLGDGTFTDRPTPDYVVGLETGVTALSMKWNGICAVKDGGVYCWGDASEGALGDGLPLYRTVPVEVVGLDSEPVITVNYETARPGSLLRVVGANFTPATAYRVEVNNQVVGEIVSNPHGVFMFMLDTTAVEWGEYSVQVFPAVVPGPRRSLFTAANQPTAADTFLIGDDLPARPKEGSGVRFITPSLYHAYLPGLMKIGEK